MFQAWSLVLRFHSLPESELIWSTLVRKSQVVTCSLWVQPAILTQGIVPQTTGQHLCIKYVFVESLLALTTNDVHACLWSLRE